MAHFFPNMLVLLGPLITMRPTTEAPPVPSAKAERSAMSWRLYVTSYYGVRDDIPCIIQRPVRLSLGKVNDEQKSKRSLSVAC
ncbi:hypothetical protein WG66_003633 [Moniliophthora roreri]|nr:hypothetical protein WG66_003633 [Moniliophthora roreri]